MPKRVGAEPPRSASGSKTQRSARRPTAIRPRSANPASVAGRSDIHRLSSASPKPRCDGLRPHRARAELQRTDPAEGAPEVAVALHFRGARRVVGHHHVECAVAAAPSHSRSRFAASRIGGHAANSVAAVGNRLGGERQVVRAGLGRDGHAGPLGVGEQRQHLRAGDVDDVGPGAGRGGGVEHQRDRVLFGGIGPRLQERRVAAAARSRAAVDHAGGSRRAPAAPSRGRRSGPSPRGTASAIRCPKFGLPESARKHLKPTHTRVGQWREVVEVLRNHAAPEADVDAAVPFVPHPVWCAAQRPWWSPGPSRAACPPAW